MIHLTRHVAELTLGLERAAAVGVGAAAGDSRRGMAAMDPIPTTNEPARAIPSGLRRNPTGTYDAAMALPPPTIAASWDDGTVADRQLVGMFDEFDVPGTFFLNSGKFGLTAAESGWKDYVRADEVRALYCRHEVGGHTLDHPDLLTTAAEETTRQVGQDRTELRRLSGQPVTGFAAPFGSMDIGVSAAAARLGYRYVRGIEATGRFTTPADLLAWQPTVHCADFDSDLVDRFLAAARPGSLLTWWGHSYEYADELGWRRLEQQLRIVRAAAEAGVRLATMGQVAAELA